VHGSHPALQHPDLTSGPRSGRIGASWQSALSDIFAAQTLGCPMDRLIVLHIVIQFSAPAGALAWARRRFSRAMNDPKLTPRA